MKPAASSTCFLALILVMACAGMPVPATNPQPPEELVTRFIEAWNAHDAEAFGKLFAADADWVTASGMRLRGREQIRDYLAGEHATWAKHTRMQSSNVHVRLMGKGGAAVMFEWEIIETGPGATPRRGNNLFVVSRAESAWLIVAGQVARKP